MVIGSERYRKTAILQQWRTTLDPYRGKDVRACEWQKSRGHRMLCRMEPPDSARNLRVFFALWPAPHERAALAAWQPRLRELCGGKPMRADNLHATLVFIGGVAPHRMEALTLAAREVQGKRFDLDFDLAHYWGHNHIVHAAPARVPAPLIQLVRDLEQAMLRHHFHFDSHPAYKPHVTLLRRARWGDAPLPPMGESRWAVGDFALVQSVAGSEGVTYEPLARFPLE
jgi:RNA 2',3'-cyclic 3'-phosphodiesterase